MRLWQKKKRKTISLNNILSLKLPSRPFKQRDCLEGIFYQNVHHNTAKFVRNVKKHKIVCGFTKKVGDKRVLNVL